MAKPGDAIVDLTDEHPEALVPYGCRAANCGTCRAEVLEGAEAFAAPADDEQDVLDIFGNEPNVRLCCQLRIIKPYPRIVLRVIAP